MKKALCRALAFAHRVAAKARGRPKHRWLRPRFATVGTIVDEASGDLELEYQNVKVPRVTQTCTAFWNGGCEAITADDVVAADPIRFRVSGRILKVKLVDSSGLGIELEPLGQSEVLLRFDRLDMHDGARVELIHDGADHVGTLGGTVRNAKGKLQSAHPHRYLAVLFIPLLGAIPELLVGLGAIPHRGIFKWIFAASIVLFLLAVLMNYEGIVEAENRSEIGLLWVQMVPERLRRNAQSFRTSPRQI